MEYPLYWIKPYKFCILEHNWFPNILIQDQMLINIVIADDEELFRVGISYILSRDKEINILYEATNGRELLDFLKVSDTLPDVIITDPPRDGMHKDVVAQILKIAPQKVVYVSCNSATQARDLALMD